MTSTNDSRQPFKKLSPAAKASMLDELDAMHKAGHLRYASDHQADDQADDQTREPSRKRES